MASAETRCFVCGALALVRFGEFSGARLSLVYWPCRHCGGENASAFDFDFDDVVPARVGRQHAKQWRDQPRQPWPWGLERTE